MNPTSTARSTATSRAGATSAALTAATPGLSHAALAHGAPPASSSPAAIEWLGGGFGFCSSSGEWFTANSTALAVLGWQRDGLTSAAIAQRLAEEFDVSAAAAERDLETFFAAGMGRFATV